MRPPSRKGASRRQGAPRAFARARLYRDGRLTLLAPYFDYAYYAYENPDFQATGLDELEHFDFFGWRRLRNPAPWFDTGYYLASNPDVLASGDNPFWHYMLKGRAEGRAPRRPRAAERAILDALSPPEARVSARPARTDGRAERRRDRRAPRRDGRGRARADPSVVEIGIDPAPRPLWATEALGVRRAGFVYLQTSPLRGPQVLRSMPAAWSETLLALDGETLGVATDATLARALDDARRRAAAAPRLRCARRARRLGRGLIAVETALIRSAAVLAQRLLLAVPEPAAAAQRRRFLRRAAAGLAGLRDLRPRRNAARASGGDAGAVRTLPLHRGRALGRRADLWRPRQRPAARGRGRRGARDRLDGRETPGAAEDRRDRRGGKAGAGRLRRPPKLADGWLTFERILEAAANRRPTPSTMSPRAEELRPSRNLSRRGDRGATRAICSSRGASTSSSPPSEGAEAFRHGALEALAAGCDLDDARRERPPRRTGRDERARAGVRSDDELVEFFVGGKAVAYARERARFPRASDATSPSPPASAALVGALRLSGDRRVHELHVRRARPRADAGARAEGAPSRLAAVRRAGRPGAAAAEGSAWRRAFDFVLDAETLSRRVAAVRVQARRRGGRGGGARPGAARRCWRDGADKVFYFAPGHRGVRRSLRYRRAGSTPPRSC